MLAKMRFVDKFQFSRALQLCKLVNFSSADCVNRNKHLESLRHMPFGYDTSPSAMAQALRLWHKPFGYGRQGPLSPAAGQVLLEIPVQLVSGGIKASCERHFCPD